MTTVTKQERAVSINPMRSCAPIGSMLANFGVHKSLTINHGSQGCASYPRHQMARHFREPIEVATTSLTEKTTVYGGKDNLVAALKNIAERYSPDLIAICSTCLSETIGDDVEAIIDEFRLKYPQFEDLPVLSVRTPSYVGTHITGFDNYLEVVARMMPRKRPGNAKDTNGRVNMIPGWVNPGDIRELKALLRDMNVNGLWITDYSDTLDGGYYGPKPHFPPGGITVEELRDSSASMATIALQKYVGGKAAETYKKRHKMPAHILPMPIGLKNTDTLLETLSSISGNPIPESLQIDRARLLDTIVDTHMFNSNLKVGIYGDPDLVHGLARFVAEIGMKPVVVLTATDSSQWGEEMKALADDIGQDMEIYYRTDMHELHKRVKELKIDMIIGHSKGKFIADYEKIPLIRVGFPIEDRFGYHRRAIVGYRGAMYLLDEITNAVLSQRGVVVSNTLMPQDMLVPVEISAEGVGSIMGGGGCGGMTNGNGNSQE